jgi:hypothetical protein
LTFKQVLLLLQESSESEMDRLRESASLMNLGLGSVFSQESLNHLQRFLDKTPEELEEATIEEMERNLGNI